MNENDLLLSVFVGVEIAHAFSAFMPSWFTVQKFATDNGDIDKLRSGYIPSVIFGLILSGIVSKLIKNPTPLIIGISVMIFMIAMYEGAIGQNLKGEKQHE